uniref:alpha/beta fold hydrolase n=1 Tax=unclassified Variovorax TaxID=663243 RepID=UPI000D374578
METSTRIARNTVAVDGEVRLSYLEAGSGPTLVLIPGWSQTAEQYRYQLEGLASRHRVIAFDLRGHGDSDKPGRGYRIARLAADLQNALVALDLRDVTIVGHSMGSSVLWCHFDLFGSGRIARYVFCDQATCLTRNPEWTDQEVADYGPIFTPDSVSETANALRGPGATQATVGFLRAMVTPGIAEETFQWIVDMNMKMPRAAAADLLYNHCHQDWREVLPRIDRPTLFIGGEGSLVPHSCMRWEATQVPNARIEVFGDGEGASHFMFIENPGKFNELLANFAG